MNGSGLDFEKPIIELERKIEELKKFVSSEKVDFTDEIRKLEEKAKKLREEIYSNLTPWQRTQLARHPRRPTTLDYINLMMENFLELHGDRAFADDQAILGGFAWLEGIPLMVIGHQKGKDTKENLVRNFGMPHPEGYRKALRLMKLAEKFNRPVVTLIDTPGAYPGIGAEERGQAEAIARNLREMARLAIPIICVVTGEGGSGGALAIGVGNKILMLENAIYSVISPEGCAAILWRNSTKAAEAAEVLKLTAQDLLKLGIIDEVVKEPLGGAHRDYSLMASRLKKAIRRNLDKLLPLSKEGLIEQRYAKFRKMGSFLEE